MKPYITIVILFVFIVSCENKKEEYKIIYSDPYITLTDQAVDTVISIDSINSIMKEVPKDTESTINEKPINNNTKERLIKTFKFKVRNLPYPVITVAGRKKGGKINKNILAEQDHISAEQEEMDMSLYYTITEFTLTTISKNGKTVENTGKSNEFTKAQKAQLNNLIPGDKVYFENVIVLLLDGKKENIGTLAFEIE